MPRIVSWAGAWLLATALVAQQDPPAPPPAKPATAAERLAALQAEQKQLVADWQKAMTEARAKASEAKTAGQAVPAMPMRPDAAPLVAKAKAAAADYAGTDDAAPFLVFVVQNSSGNREEVAAAFETLTTKHLDHAALAGLGPMIGFLPRLLPDGKGAEFAERCAKSGNADVRGWALSAKHGPTIEKADRDSDAYKTARAELLAAAEQVGDARLKSDLLGSIETREKFGVGVTAPDIEGQDLDGVAFKLSDYKGKVIFLDFWGDW